MTTTAPRVSFKTITTTLFAVLATAALLMPTACSGQTPVRSKPSVSSTPGRPLSVPNKARPGSTSSATSRDQSSKELPSKSVADKKNPTTAERRCINLLKAGMVNEQREKKIGFTPKNAAEKGKKIKVQVKPVLKVKGASTRTRAINPAGRLAISRNDYFKKPLKTPERKAIFKNTGIEGRTIKSRILSPELMRTPKSGAKVSSPNLLRSIRRVNEARRKDGLKRGAALREKMRFAHSSHQTASSGSAVSVAGSNATAVSGPTQNANATTPTAPGNGNIDYIAKPDLCILSVKNLNDEGHEAELTDKVMLIEHKGRERTLTFSVIIRNEGLAPALDFDVTVKHVDGRSWTSTAKHFAKIEPKQEFSARVTVNIPWDVESKPGHILEFTVDEAQKTDDVIRCNNVQRFPLDVIAVPNLKITHVRCMNPEVPDHNLTQIRKSTKGKWLEFYVSIKNEGFGTAYRFDTVCEHISGPEWPSEDFHMVNLPKDMSTVVLVKILIPQNAPVKSGNTLRFKVDPHRVNPDSDYSDNVKTVIFNLLPPMEPDLYFKKFSRRERDDEWYIPGCQRGGIEFDYKIEIGNQGIAKAQPFDINFKVQKIDHKGSNQPWLHLDRTYSIPALEIAKSYVFDTKNFWVYNDQSARIDCIIDPDTTIAESNKGNNKRAAEFSVAIANPFSGTWLGDLFGAIGGFFVDVGGALYDGATWVYNGVKAASQYALAGIFTPEMVLWVETNYGIHYPQARSLNSTERAVLAPHFPQSLIDSTRIQLVDAWTQPELWGDGAGVTYGEGFSGKSVIVIQRGKMSNAILVHEMVHAYQYKKLGLGTFCWKYMYTWVKSGFEYRSISLEKQAYGFENAYRSGKAGTIGSYLGN